MMHLPLPAMICMFVLGLFSEWTCAMPLALDTPRIDELVHAENAVPKFLPTPIPSVAVRDGDFEKQYLEHWQTGPSIDKRTMRQLRRLEIRFLTHTEIMKDTGLPAGIRKFAQEDLIQYHGNATSTTATTTTAAAEIQEQAKSMIRSHLLWNSPYGKDGLLYFGEKKDRMLIFPDDNSDFRYPFSSIPDSGVAYEIHDRREGSLGPCKPMCHGAAWISKILERKCEGKIYDWSQ
ncbi:hypothetical protein F5051DRAFT_417411 [Lentinula edodes]|nr:hypothetical protein F5051DRAFT_417411 [Lentinula edodes]